MHGSREWKIDNVTMTNGNWHPHSDDDACSMTAVEASLVMMTDYIIVPKTNKNNLKKLRWTVLHTYSFFSNSICLLCTQHRVYMWESFERHRLLLLLALLNLSNPIRMPRRTLLIALRPFFISILSFSIPNNHDFFLFSLLLPHYHFSIFDSLL